jgi:hypothetical protein
LLQLVSLCISEGRGENCGITGSQRTGLAGVDIRAEFASNGAPILQVAGVLRSRKGRTRLLTDDAHRASVVRRLANGDTRNFFGVQFEQWRATFREEAIDPVLNKVEAFLAFPSIKNILGQGRSTLHLSRALQERRIVIVNLATGSIGETGARLTGALVLAHVRAAAMARARLPIGVTCPVSSGHA